MADGLGDWMVARLQGERMYTYLNDYVVLYEDARKSSMDANQHEPGGVWEIGS